MIRLRPFAALAAFLLLASPAQAGSTVVLSCLKWSTELKVGAGRQMQAQGLELAVMECRTTGRFASYARMADPAKVKRLEALAAMDVKDGARVQDFVDVSKALGPEFADQFGAMDEMTFGDVRSTLLDLAKPTGEMVNGTRIPYYTHHSCGKLVPLDYYRQPGTLAVICVGAPLTITEGSGSWN